ncbi:hypothetical protein GF352_02875 [archaeon]|nr:hypothetical protein [archaeon]
MNKDLKDYLKTFFHNELNEVSKIQNELRLLIIKQSLPTETKNTIEKIIGYSTRLGKSMRKAYERLYNNNKQEYSFNTIISYLQDNIKPPINVEYKKLINRDVVFNINLESLTEQAKIFINNSAEANADKLEIILQEVDGRTSVWLKDNGDGMTEEEAANCFKNGFTTKKEGHGWGLSLIKDCLKNKGYSISVESAKGQGTTFKITQIL